MDGSRIVTGAVEIRKLLLLELSLQNEREMLQVLEIVNSGKPFCSI